MHFKYKYSLIVKTISSQAIQFSQIVLIPTIQFSISMQFVLFNPKMGPYQVLLFLARVDQGAVAMKVCTAFPIAPASLEPHYKTV